MTQVKYKHLVEYDENTKKIIIFRLLESETSHLYTELALDDIDPSRRSLEEIGRMLGEAIVLDTPRLRDEVMKRR